jgi:ABC-type multidrug transport system permease subunit
VRRRLSDVRCVFEIHLARLRTEAGPFLLAALVFPAVMYMFASAIGGTSAPGADPRNRLRFLAGSIVFSISLTAISWLGYLLLENRFTGRLKLFATLPLAPSSYVTGIIIFALAQAMLGTIALLAVAAAAGVHTGLQGPLGLAQLFAVAVLTVLCVCGVAVIVAARARSFSEGALLTDALGAGLVFLAPVYCQPQALPRILQLLAPLLPTTYAAHGVQSALAGAGAIGRDLLVLGAMATVTLAVSFRASGWREE